MSDNWELSLKYECHLVNEQDEIILKIKSELLRNSPYLSILLDMSSNGYEKEVDKWTQVRH